MSNRREFLKQSTLPVAALPVLGALLGLPADVGAQAAPETANQSIINFWTQDVRKPSQAFAKGQTLMGGPAYQPAFVSYVSPGVFQASSDITTTDLPANGQVNIAVRVERFRPSTTSGTLFSRAQSGSLRLDVKQTQPLPSLAEALAWTAVAGFLPKANSTQFGDLQDLNFNPGTSWGQLQTVPLTNGLGFWSWNFFLTPKASFWGQMMTLFRETDKTVFPLLGMPGIALTALNAIDKLIGYAQAKTQSDWLFKSVETPVFATKEGQKAIGQGGLPLKTGHYLVIPTEHLAEFGSVRTTLDLQDGYLVKTGTDAFHLADNAATQIPAVDYLSVYVNVTQASAQNPAQPSTQPATQKPAQTSTQAPNQPAKP